MCYRSITKQLIWIRHLSDIILMRSKWGMRPRSRCCCHRLHLTPKTSRLDRVAVQCIKGSGEKPYTSAARERRQENVRGQARYAKRQAKKSHLHFKCRGCFPLDVYETWLLGLSECKKIWHQRAAQRKQNNNTLLLAEENTTSKNYAPASPDYM